MTFETFIALRQLRSGRSGSLSVLSSIAIIGVVLAVATQVTVMSATGGFQRLFREKVLGLNAHVLVMRYGLDFKEYREVMQRAEELPDVLGASPFLFNEMLVSAGDALSSVMVKGIDPASIDKVSDLRSYMGGDAKQLSTLARGGHGHTPGIILGKELAGKLGVKVGDPILLVSPLRGIDPTRFSSRDLAPTSAPFTVHGIYTSGFYEYDARMVFVHYGALQTFFHQGDTVTGVELKVSDVFHSQQIAREVRVRLGDQRYSVLPWAAAQLDRYEQLTTRRSRVRLGILVAIALQILLAFVLLLRWHKARRAVRGLVFAAWTLLILLQFGGGWVTGWGAFLLPGPELGLSPHISVQRDNGDFLEYRNALVEARILPQVRAAGAYIRGLARVILPGGQDVAPARPEGKERTIRVRGYDSSAGTLPLERYLVEGEVGYLVPPMLPESRMPPYRALIGQQLASELGLSVGDTFRIAPTRGIRGRPLPQVGPYAVEVVGLLRTGDPQADGETLFMDFLSARRILSLVDAAEGIEVWLHDPMDAKAQAAALSSRLGGHSYRTLDWKEINHNIFRSLELQKYSLSLVMFVITVVAALMIVSTLVMMVIDKAEQVAILKAMGATSGGVMRVFVVEGFLIGLVGTLAGLALGFGFCHLLASIEFPLQAEVYLIDHLPVDIALSDFVVAGTAALVVSLLATVYPSLKAASLTPVEGMREV